VFVDRHKNKGKGNTVSALVARAKGRGYGAIGDSECCAGGEGTSGEDALVADRHSKMGVACINLGGWRKRNR
jgi:hypothetical protein